MRRIHRHSSHTRDAALRKLTAANRWMIAGSVALTGVLAEAAAQAFPGKKLPSKSARAARHSSGGSERPTETPESFHPPEQPPQAAGEAQGAEGDDGATTSESAPRSGEAAPPSTESPPPAENSAQGSSEAPTSEEAPPVVSGGS
jgi:hypothetical protein